LELVKEKIQHGSSSRSVRKKSNLFLMWKAFKKDKAAVFGAIIVILSILIAILAPVISPYDPNVAEDTSLRLKPPGTEGHLLGLDGQGRDILSRLLHGTLLSLSIGFLPVLFAFIISVTLGVIAGYYQGWLGTLIMRVMDILFAFPMVLLGVALAAVLGSGFPNLVTTLTIVFIPYLTRVVYSATIEVREKEFIVAAKACGSRDFQIILGDIVPNILSRVIVYCTTNIGLMIVFGSGLSFLGLGIQPPDAEWGSMTRDGKDVISLAPHVAAFPGIAILLVAVGFNFLGDGLRDALDPHLRDK